MLTFIDGEPLKARLLLRGSTVVSESHQFLYEFLVLSGDMACQQTYVLDSI